VFFLDLLSHRRGVGPTGRRPSALPPDLWIGRPAVSPTDKLRKDSALTPVTSEKSTLFSWVTKIVRSHFVYGIHKMVAFKVILSDLSKNEQCANEKYLIG
jgi:hypothetical protein